MTTTEIPPWEQRETTYADRRRAEPDIQPTSLQTVHQHLPVSDGLGELAQLAAAQGPRDPKRLRRRATEIGRELGAQLRPDGSCAAYYSWQQGKGMVEGPTIDLVEALAGEWGRIVHRVTIVREEPTRVYLLARVVDLVTLGGAERPYVAAIAPASGKMKGRRDQEERWYTMQLQSGCSKAIRTVLEDVLPAWFVSTAVAAAKVSHARAVLQDKDLGEGLTEAAGWLKAKHGIDEAVLVAWLEIPRGEWGLEVLHQLRVLAYDIRDGRRTVDQVRREALGDAAERDAVVREEDVGAVAKEHAKRRAAEERAERAERELAKREAAEAPADLVEVVKKLDREVGRKRALQVRDQLGLAVNAQPSAVPADVLERWHSALVAL